ncbi:MAG: LamG-like jellyroll fold domain-containing protein [Bacteroidales bacterium]
MKKKLSLLISLAILPMLAFSQATPQHEMYVPMGAKVSWDDAYKKWVPGSGKPFYEGLDEAAAENENFFISRVKPRERFTFSQTQVRPEQNSGRKLLWWCPIGGDGWNALPSYFFGGEVWGMWSYTDIWGDWTAPLVTIPAALLDVCHKNGVQISCCAPIAWAATITPTSDGYGRLLGTVLQDPAGHEKFLKYLQYYGADGIGFNSEFTWAGYLKGGKYGGRSFGRGMQAFLGDCYTDAAKYGVPFHNCWYSLTNSDGGYGGGASLGNENKDWFHYNGKPTSTAYFMNYRGSLSQSQNTVRNNFPSRSSFDVFMGVNYQSGENLPNWLSLNNYDISLGMWGAHNRNSIYETRGERGSDPIQQQKTYQMILENVFTGSSKNPVNPPAINMSTRFNSTASDAYGWAQYIVAKSSLTGDLGSDPFITYFNLGNGNFFNVNGERTADVEWYNIGMQDYTPTWRWWFTKTYMGRNEANVSSDLKAEFIWDDAWFGGSCLQISGETKSTYTQLFKTKYNTNISGDYITIRYKVVSGVGSLAWACSVEKDPGKEVLSTIKNNAKPENGWVELRTQIANSRNGLKVQGEVLALIGLKFTNTTADFKILLGEISVTRGKEYSTPETPIVKKSKVLGCNYKGVDMKIIYDMVSDKIAPVYNTDVKTWFYKIYTQQEGLEPVMFNATTSWAAYVVGAPYDVTKGGKIRIGVAAMSLDGRSESVTTWGEWLTLPAPTVVEGTKINKPIIKANEEFTISFIDPNHPAAKWEIINSATGTVVYTANSASQLTTSLSVDGSYDTRVISSDGTEAFTRGIIQISPEKVGSIPILKDLKADKSSAYTNDAITLTYGVTRLGEGKVSRSTRISDPNLLRFPEVIPSRPYTYMMWFKIEKFTHSSQGTNLMDKRSFGDMWPHNNWGDLWVTIRPECGSLRESGPGGTMGGSEHKANEISFNTYGWTEHDSPCDQMMSTGYSVNTNQWTHVAVTFDTDNSQKMYFNGKLVASTKIQHITNNGVRNAGSPIYVGGTSTYKSGFNGWIDEFQAWNRVLSEAEIQTAMKGYDAAPIGLVGYWTFEDIVTDGDGMKVFPNKGTKGESFYAKNISTQGVKGEDTGSAIETVVNASNDELGNPAISGSYEVKTTPKWSLPDATGITESGNSAVTSYAAEGTYTAGLTLGNMWGNDSKTLIDYVVVTFPDGVEESVIEVMGIYPNPFTDFVNIMFTKGGKYTAQIVALDGKLIETKELNVSDGEGVRVDVNGDKGTYVLQILNSNGTAVRTVKIVKK